MDLKKQVHARDESGASWELLQDDVEESTDFYGVRIRSYCTVRSFNHMADETCFRENISFFSFFFLRIIIFM